MAQRNKEQAALDFLDRVERGAEQPPGEDPST
jgi:hypothetical protein